MLLHHGHNTKGVMLGVRKRGTLGTKEMDFVVFLSQEVIHGYRYVPGLELQGPW